MTKITGSPEGRGLGGTDGAGQAGMIRQKVFSLGRIPEAIIVSRYAPESIVSGTCTCPACNGLHPNLERQEAILTLANHLKDIVLKNYFVSRKTCIAFIHRYFRTKKISLNDIAKISKKHPNTIAKQYKMVLDYMRGQEVFVDVGGRKEKRNYPGIDTRTMRDIDILLTETEIVTKE